MSRPRISIGVAALFAVVLASLLAGIGWIGIRIADPQSISHTTSVHTLQSDAVRPSGSVAPDRLITSKPEALPRICKATNSIEISRIPFAASFCLLWSYDGRTLAVRNTARRYEAYRRGGRPDWG